MTRVTLLIRQSGLGKGSPFRTATGGGQQRRDCHAQERAMFCLPAIFSTASSSLVNCLPMSHKECRPNCQQMALLENPRAKGPDIGTDVQGTLPKKSEHKLYILRTITIHL